MKSHIANVIDIEHQEGRLIEVGLTTVDLKKREIIQTYSFPVWERDLPELQPEISPEIYKLTGWTTNKLKKQGEPFKTIAHRIIKKHGGFHRPVVVDSQGDLTLIARHCMIEFVYGPYPFGQDQLNVSTLFAIETGDFNKGKSLNQMLEHYDLEFIGTPHRGSEDSFNIARLLLKVLHL